MAIAGKRLQKRQNFCMSLRSDPGGFHRCYRASASDGQDQRRRGENDPAPFRYKSSRYAGSRIHHDHGYDQKRGGCGVYAGGKTVTIGAMSKGSGMIHPNMCTMLAFIMTDAAISRELLQKALSSVVKDTYNMISVDGIPPPMTRHFCWPTDWQEIP